MRRSRLSGLSAGTGKLCIFGHLGLVFIWSCFVSCLLLLLYYVICAPVLTEGTRLSGTQFSSNAVNSIPLSFLPWSLAYFDDLYQWIHIFLFLSRYFAEKLKNKASFEGQHQSRGDAKMSIAIMLISSDLICIIWQSQKKNSKKSLVALFFGSISGLFC